MIGGEAEFRNALMEAMGKKATACRKLNMLAALLWQGAQKARDESERSDRLALRIMVLDIARELGEER